MRRLICLGLIFSAGAVAGCSDTPPTGQPSFDAAAGAGGGTTGGGVGGNGGGGATAGAAGGNAGNDAGVDAPSVGGSSGGAAAGIAGTAGAAGAAGVAGAPQLAPPTPTGLVALNSDFSTTSLSILSTTGGLLHADCVDSATGSNGGPSKTISGNTFLPSQPQRGGDIVIVDSGNGALTFVDPARCNIARQVALPGGAKTNPHDVVILADAKAYVTRYDKNLAATTAALAGNDVLVIDPTSGAMTGRIGLDAYASAVSGGTVQARPDRALIAGGKVVVSLNEIDAGFATYGEGKVVVIDPTTDQVVAAVALTGLYDCEGMTYVESNKTLLVACGGPYGSQNQPLQSGIAVVDLGASPPRLTRSISSVAFDDRPIDFAWVVALPPTGGGTRAFAVTNDPSFTTPDAIFAFDYVLGTTTQFATSDPYTIGQPAGVPGLLLVPETTFSTPQIKLFDVSGVPHATSGFASDPVTGLPAVEVTWY